MEQKDAQDYYNNDAWDESSWVDIISIEYEQLIKNYPFDEALKSFSTNKPITLLDVGCGTGIFPSYLDEELSDSIQLSCDLLDLSESSLRQAKLALNSLDHFTVNRLYQSFIEDIPTALPANKTSYGVIWGIHSFTTVDIAKMPGVYSHLLDLLAPNGYFFVYQLTANSAYQKLHGYYRANHPNGKQANPFMEYEDTKQILDAMGVAYEVYELHFNHEINDSPPELLQKYLHKCILDDSVNVLDFFKDLLGEFHDGRKRKYVIPQSVNFVVIRK